MEPLRPHLYRGTTIGWTGNEVLQSLGLTPTTDDPLVATLFALDASRYGPAIVQVCESQAVAELMGPGNVLSQIERERVIGVPPASFTERFVIQSIEVQQARRVLAEMGFELPAGFANKDVFRFVLNEAPRLSDRDVDRFDRLTGIRV